ncbi:MAG: ATP-dependent zinc metalloprotease FtsH [Thermodesulfobacteriota bacterium]|nr:MAG: ATP-dependent zinc metalloprotease FtsH [Thermodesulfobacteriota bacterium]
MRSIYKNLLLWLTFSLILIVIYHIYNQPRKPIEKINYSQFITLIEQGKVTEITIQGKKIQGSRGNGESFKTYAPDDPDLIKTMREKGVKINAEPDDGTPWTSILFSFLLPTIFFVVLWVFFIRQVQSGGKAMSFGKSRHRVLSDSQEPKVTFKDVAGVEEPKQELEEIIEFLKNPKKFTTLGGRIPKGVLLIGAPGTGKTLLARAIAGEANVHFFSISGSDFVEMFVGVGASRVRDLFLQGKKHAPCIIFIDEIDAVGRHRGAGLGGGHDEREQTLNQLLVEMDGFESSEGVIIISATNRPDVLDPALVRPGRFDRQVIVPIPDIKGREKILEVHTQKTPLGDDVNLGIIARGTPGLCGADLANLVNEAALLAARKGRTSVIKEDFEQAKDKVLMGVERRSMVISPEEKKITAYHEAGHTLVAKLIPGTDPIHKVTIIPRGHALGLTQQLPIDERHTYPKQYLIDCITVLLGGRGAEELVLESLTTGAGNDLERATEIARKMVCEWGMSDDLGPLTFGKKEEQIFLGREIAQHRDYSEDTALKIDHSIRKIVEWSHIRAQDLLRENEELLHILANTLLENESLDGEEVDRILMLKNQAGLNPPQVESPSSPN